MPLRLNNIKRGYVLLCATTVVLSQPLERANFEEYKKFNLPKDISSIEHHSFFKQSSSILSIRYQ